MEANTMNPDQTADLIWVQIVCKIDERVDVNYNHATAIATTNLAIYSNETSQDKMLEA